SAAHPAGPLRHRRADWPGRARLVAPAARPAADVRPGLPRVVLAHPPGLARRDLSAGLCVLPVARAPGRHPTGARGGAVRRGMVRLDPPRVPDPPLLVSLHAARSGRHVLRLHDSRRAPCLSGRRPPVARAAGGERCHQRCDLSRARARAADDGPGRLRGRPAGLLSVRPVALCDAPGAVALRVVQPPPPPPSPAPLRDARALVRRIDAPLGLRVRHDRARPAPRSERRSGQRGQPPARGAAERAGRRAAPVSQPRVSEWIAGAYFAYLFAAAWIVPPWPRRRAAAAASLVAAVAAGLLSSFWPAGPRAAVVRDWLPALYLVVGYWLSGWYFAAPMAAVERRFLAIDGRVLGC